MKNLILNLLIITFLFQSCYTYHNVNLGSEKLKLGSVYKIKLEEKTRVKEIKLISFNDSIAKVKISNYEKDIKISEIKSIKERKSSSGKTALLLLPLLLIGVVILIFPNKPIGG